MTRDSQVLEGKSSISERIAKEEKKGLRKLTGPLGFIGRIVAILLPIYSFLFIMDMFSHFNIFIFWRYPQRDLSGRPAGPGFSPGAGLAGSTKRQDPVVRPVPCRAGRDRERLHCGKLRERHRQRRNGYNRRPDRPGRHHHPCPVRGHTKDTGVADGHYRRHLSDPC